MHYGGKIQAQSRTSQSSYYSSNDPRLHFGLGIVSKVDVEIFWPSGLVEHLKDIPADQLVTIQEGKGIIKTQRLAGQNFQPAKNSSGQV
jgi:hypothetical protein